MSRNGEGRKKNDVPFWKHYVGKGNKAEDERHYHPQVKPAVKERRGDSVRRVATLPPERKKMTTSTSTT